MGVIVMAIVTKTRNARKASSVFNGMARLKSQVVKQAVEVTCTITTIASRMGATPRRPCWTSSRRWMSETLKSGASLNLAKCGGMTIVQRTMVGRYGVAFRCLLALNQYRTLPSTLTSDLLLEKTGRCMNAHTLVEIIGTDEIISTSTADVEWTG